MRHSKEPSAFTIAFLVILSGIIPAFCLGYVGIGVLLAVALYVYHKEAGTEDIKRVWWKNLREQAQESEDLDYNDEYLERYFNLENGEPIVSALQDKYKSRLEFRLQETFTVGKPLDAADRDALCNPDRYQSIIRGDHVYRRVSQYEMTEARIRDNKYEIDKWPEIFKDNLVSFYSVPVSNPSAAIAKNVRELWISGVSDGMKPETIGNENIEILTKYRNGVKSGFEFKKSEISFKPINRELYDRIHKAWKDNKLPPKYSSNIYGAAQAYVDWATGDIKFNPDGTMLVAIAGNRYCTGGNFRMLIPEKDVFYLKAMNQYKI